MTKRLERGIGDVSGWVDFVKSILGDLQSSGDVQNGALMEKHSDSFAQMAADVVAAVQDGFGLDDVVIFGDLVTDVMKIAKDIDGATGEQKEQFVIDSVWLIYHSVDMGPDGNHNRIKVPGAHWLSALGMTTTEEKIERFILKVGTQFAIRSAYSYMKEKGDV